MSCGGRIYKGGAAYIELPLNTSGVTELTVEFYTDDTIKVEKTIEDIPESGSTFGVSLDASDLETLSEGVLSYTITYTYEGEEYTDAGNTSFYLKTPVGYSAQTISELTDEAYTSGYTAGLNDCSGSTDCSSAVTEAYQSGYTAGQADCPECSGSSCNLEAGVLNLIADGPTWSMSPSVGYDGWNSITVNDMGYGQGKYNEGYAAGQAECSGCSLQNKNALISYDNMEAGYEGVWIVYPDAGYYGMDIVRIHDNGYGNKKYNDGIEQGAIEQKAKMVSLTANTNDWYSREDGYSDVVVSVSGYNFSMIGSIVFEEDFTIDSDFNIAVFVDRTDGTTLHAIGESYINIDNQWLDSIKSQGVTFSAGTYSFGVAAMESGGLDGVDDFYLEDPIAYSGLGSQLPIHFDNIHIEFSKYPR